VPDAGMQEVQIRLQFAHSDQACDFCILAVHIGVFFYDVSRGPV